MTVSQYLRPVVKLEKTEKNFGCYSKMTAVC